MKQLQFNFKLLPSIAFFIVFFCLVRLGFWQLERADQKTDRYGVGDKVDATVTNVDKKQRKISLSIKAKEIEEEKKAMAEYGSSDSGASLGDILGAALAKKDNSSKN